MVLVERTFVAAQATGRDRAGSYLSCEYCPTLNRASAERCRACGAALRSGETMNISFSLSFPAGACTECGQPGPPGTCLECGGDVPATAEESESVEARIRALGPLRDEADALLGRYQTISEPHIPVAPDQYAAALADSRVLARMRVSMRFPHRLGGFDLDDVAIIEGTLYEAAAKYVAELEAIHRAVSEIAWFIPPNSEVDRARRAMIASGRHATEIGVTVLRALAGSSLDDVSAHQIRLRQLFDGFPYAADFAEALAALETLPSADFDARVSLAFRTDLVATDPFGLLDPARVFTAFAGTENPLGQLAQASVGYLAHLIGEDVGPADPEAAGLGMTVLALASLDRPLPAHRVARNAIDLFREAHCRNPTAAIDLLERTVGQGPRIFAAAKRIQDDVYYLTSGLARDESDLVRRLIDTYKALAESSFRAYAWLVRDAYAIIDGRYDPSATLPMIGPLEKAMSQHADALSDAVARAVDRKLRNAEAHEDWRYDEATGHLVLGDEFRLSLAQFGVRFERLLTTVIGLDAAFACFSVLYGKSEVPEWLVAGEAPFATEMLVRGMLGANGMELVAIREDEGLTFVVATPAEPSAALVSLAGIAPLVTHEQLAIETESGKEVVTAEKQAFAEFAVAEEPVKDLALFAPLYSAGSAAGKPHVDLLADTMALFIALIAAVDIPAVRIAIGIGNAQPFKDLRTRLSYVISFVENRRGSDFPEISHVVQDLRTARRMLVLVIRGEQRALLRLIAALTSAAEWADKRGYRWPLI
jgi:hypothetical protein